MGNSIRKDIEGSTGFLEQASTFVKGRSMKTSHSKIPSSPRHYNTGHHELRVCTSVSQILTENQVQIPAHPLLYCQIQMKLNSLNSLYIDTIIPKHRFAKNILILFLSHVVVQFFLHHLLKRLSFLHCIFFPNLPSFVIAQVTIGALVDFWAFYPVPLSYISVFMLVPHTVLITVAL